MTESFRLIQDGQPVAWAEGNNSLAEIAHYAAVYAQDGPVKVQKKAKGRWKDVASWPNLLTKRRFLNL